MNTDQRHRGPDDEGTQRFDLADGHLALGHRRLSIIDLSAAGHQPMVDPTAHNWIVYNGELYNFVELRRELQSRGTRFRTKTDTEVVLKAYAVWGEQCFNRFCGMFALAIHDASNRRLVLARDHLGIKPLYVAQSSEAFAFASELGALRSSGLFGNEIDRRGLAGLLAYGAVPEPLTIAKDVRMLEAGTFAVLDLAEPQPWRAGLQTSRYWDFPIPRHEIDAKEVRGELQTRLKESVRSHLISDVPVGVFLSSGIDSNAIAALAREHRGANLDAFTVTLDDHPEVNEGQVAASVARSLGIRFHSVSLTESQVQQQTREFLESIDQPTVDGLNTYIISQAVRERGITVALSGLGGDEVFGGYNSFRESPRLARWHQAAKWLPPETRAKIAAWLYRHQPSSRRFKAIELASKPRDLRSFCLRRRRLLSDIELVNLGFAADNLDLDHDYMSPESAPDRQLADCDPVAAVSILESRFYMGNTLLRDSDVFGMRHGLEIRVPLLDRRIVDFAYALPGQMRVKRSATNKPLLVEALGSRLRPDLLRLKKRGFHVPIARWMCGPLRELVDDSLVVVKQSGLFDPRAVDAVWQSFLKHPDGPHWSRAWMLCVLGKYLAIQSRSHRRLQPSAA